MSRLTFIRSSLGGELATLCATLAEEGADEVERLDPAWMQSPVNELVQEQEQPHQYALDNIRANCIRTRTSASRGSLPTFVGGDYVMMARERKHGELPKLVGTWSRCWWVVSADGQHVYGVEDIVTGQRKDAHVARKSPYADSSLAGYLEGAGRGGHNYQGPRGG